MVNKMNTKIYWINMSVFGPIYKMASTTNGLYSCAFGNGFMHETMKDFDSNDIIEHPVYNVAKVVSTELSLSWVQQLSMNFSFRQD